MLQLNDEFGFDVVFFFDFWMVRQNGEKDKRNNKMIENDC